MRSEGPQTPLAVMAKPVGSRCNMRCTYCYYLDKGKYSENKKQTRMSFDLLEKLIRQTVAASPGPVVSFTWHGGEPTLAGLDFYRKALELEKKYLPKGWEAWNNLQTNGLLLNEGWCRFLKENRFDVGLSIDGPNAEVHDAFRGFSGSFAKAMEMLDYARNLDLPVQVNTSVTRRNAALIDPIAEMLEGKGIAIWSVFFLVPVGRGVEEVRITPEEYIGVFERLWHHAQTKSYAVKTTEAPHYRRYVLERGGNPLAPPRRAAGGENIGRGRRARAPLGVTDGRGIMFCGHNGEIFPAGFLPIACGRFPRDSVIDIYQNHPLFRALHDPNNYKGICGRCEYRCVCGGSRSRAYALTGDPLAAEPDCAFES